MTASEKNIATDTRLSAGQRYRQERIAHWNAVAASSQRGVGAYYHQRLAKIYRFLIPPGLRVLELGCGEGNLLAAAQPSAGIGVDFSDQMLAQARARHPDPQLRFIPADAHHLDLGDDTFDIIILSDLLNDVWDVQQLLEGVRRYCTSRTRILLNSYSRLWEWPLRLARRTGMGRPMLQQNWLTVQDLRNLLDLAGFELMRHWEEILFPLPIPFITPLCNKTLVRLWPLRHLALTNFIVARPTMPRFDRRDVPEIKEPRVSVIVPARNEAGNIEEIFARVPEMGGGTELVFVEGHSRDDTYAAIESALARNPHRVAQLHRQTGAGKGDAVRLGYACATGDILMILDADLTVDPDDLPRFFDAIRTGKGEFINGVRLVYPMEKQAMRFFNLVGNKLFSTAFSWLLGQPVKDTLCGTKVLWRDDYQRLAANRAYFGDFDPFGDFDLIFGAAKLNLRLLDLPIRYRQRTYGTTNIQRWKHGWLLMKMLAFAASKMKFV